MALKRARNGAFGEPHIPISWYVVNDALLTGLLDSGCPLDSDRCLGCLLLANGWASDVISVATAGKPQQALLWRATEKLLTDLSANSLLALPSAELMARTHR